MTKPRLRPLLLAVLLAGLLLPAPAAADWRQDFDQLCGATSDADTLPAGRLRELVAEADRLVGVIEGLDSPDKKVFLFRTRKCRDFFAYMLSVREADSTGAGRSGQ
ncbi:MAG: hypothetical protein AB1634_12345 [Thermodesulfobacteriota bacterium]